jgi:hypothetical protein
MRWPAHPHFTAADLKWCLLPALALDQFMTAEAKLPDGQAVPATMVCGRPGVRSKIAWTVKICVRLHR